MIKFFLSFIFLIFYSFSIFAQTVRVLLPKSEFLSSSGKTLIKGENIKKVFNSPYGRLKVKEGKIEYKGIKWGKNLEFSPEKGIFKWGRRKYRGLLKVYFKNGIIIPVNFLPLEDYLKGVIKGEISPSWPIETIKAQVVACRSYALYSISPDKLYDLTSGINDMVYGGVYFEDKKINKAISETYREVLVRKGKIVPGFFSACCGGHTEWASYVWKKAPKYFYGVKCQYCKDSPYYHWRLRISKYSLSKHLGIKNIKDIKITSFTPSGRAKEIKVIGKDEDKIYDGNVFRKKIGYSLIHSTFFKVRVGLFFVTFSGKGWGHGVGLCQWGAKKMGEKGYSYKEILNFYYPFAKVKKYEKGRI